MTTGLFFKSRAAHNSVVLPDAVALRHPSSSLLRSAVTPTSYDAVIDISAYEGVSDQRRVVFSRRLGYLVVDDEVSANLPQAVNQLWHLGAGRSVQPAGTDARSTGPGANVLIRQLVDVPQPTVVKGQTDPLQGWVPVSWGWVKPAPVVVYASSGKSVRFLTLLVPVRDASTPVTVTNLTTGSRSFSFTIAIGHSTEKVTASASTLTIK